MFASLSARFALVAALVFSQVLLAEHSAQHDPGGQPQCHICLQTSAGGAALPGSDYLPFIEHHPSPRNCDRIYTAPRCTIENPHPSRAPPGTPS